MSPSSIYIHPTEPATVMSPPSLYPPNRALQGLRLCNLRNNRGRSSQQSIKVTRISRNERAKAWLTTVHAGRSGVAEKEGGGGGELAQPTSEHVSNSRQISWHQKNAIVLQWNCTSPLCLRDAFCFFFLSLFFFSYSGLFKGRWIMEWGLAWFVLFVFAKSFIKILRGQCHCRP